MLVNRISLFTIIVFITLTGGDYVNAHFSEWANAYWSLMTAGILAYFLLIIENIKE